MTPRCFAAWSKGRAKGEQRKIEEAVVLSWLTGARTAEAMNGKLKPLDKVLAKIVRRPKRKQSPAEMFAILLQFQAGGAPLDISQVN